MQKETDAAFFVALPSTSGPDPGAWEDLWRVSRGPLRLFYQGLIQAAVGLHHLNNGNLNGARAQITKSISKLDQYPDWFCRINNRKLIVDLKDALDGDVSRAIVIEQAA